MKLKRALAAAGIGLALTFALGACDTDDDLNGDDGDVGATTTTILGDTTTLVGETTTSAP